MPDAPSLPPLQPLRISGPYDLGLHQAHWWARSSPGLLLGQQGSACVALRPPSAVPLAVGQDGFPPGLRDSRELRQQSDSALLCAEQAMVANAALQGICLSGATAYIWPFLSSPAAAAALVGAGCVIVVVPRLYQPARIQERITRSQSVVLKAGARYLEVPCPLELLGED